MIYQTEGLQGKQDISVSAVTMVSGKLMQLQATDRLHCVVYEMWRGWKEKS